MISRLLEGFVSLERITNFLDEPESDHSGTFEKSDFMPTMDKPVHGRITITNGDFSWSLPQLKTVASRRASLRSNTVRLPQREHNLAPESGNAPNGENGNSEQILHLRNINVDFPMGKISLVIGKTGSGKSSLLAAMLDEMIMVKGEKSLPEYEI